MCDIKLLEKYNYPEEILEACRVLNSAGWKSYLVGGSIRDIILNRDIKDFDITTDAEPNDVKKILKKTVDTGLKHGTVTVYINDFSIEITTFRKDGEYSDGRHPDSVSYTTSLNDDLIRRDFTMNAICYNPIDKSFFDFFDGVSDIQQKLIKAIDTPVKRFREDALRMMRAIRFSCQLNFTIENRTFDAIKECSELLKKISKERIRDELNKILTSNTPNIGLFFLEQGELIKYVINDKDFHEKIEFFNKNILDSRINSFYENQSNKSFFENLNLDLTKKDFDIRITHFFNYLSENITSNINKSEKIKEIMFKLKYPNKTIDLVEHLSKFINYDISKIVTDFDVRVFIQKLKKENIEIFFDLNTIYTEKNSYKEKNSRLFEFKNRVDSILEKNPPLNISDLDINGGDLMKIFNLKPSKMLKNALQLALDYVIEFPEKNRKEMLVDFIKENFFLK